MKRIFSLLSIVLLPLLLAACPDPDPNAVNEVNNLNIEIQAVSNTSTVTAEWFYTAPDSTWIIDYIYKVTDVSEGIIIFEDTTVSKLVTFDINRSFVDKDYDFAVAVRRISPQPRVGVWKSERFTVPLVEQFALLYELPTPITTPIVVAHDPAFEVDSGTVWIEFIPNTITGEQGLFSKDHSGYGTGGHFTISVSDGQIKVRIQDLSQSYQLVAGTIVDLVVNQVAVTFGDELRLYVNGILVASSVYSGGIVGNTETIVIGAESSNDQAGESLFTTPFDGTIEVVEFYRGFYDFSGRWGDIPLPPPGPVDSVTINVAHISYGMVMNQSLDYVEIAFAPIVEAEYYTLYLDGKEEGTEPLWFGPIGFPGNI